MSTDSEPFLNYIVYLVIASLMLISVCCSAEQTEEASSCLC